VNYAHVLPVVGELAAAIQTDHIVIASDRRNGLPRRPGRRGGCRGSRCKGFRHPFMAATDWQQL